MSPDDINHPADPAGVGFPPARTTPQRALVHRVAITVIVLLTLGYFFWSAVCGSDHIPPIRERGDPETDHFNLLNHGFLRGHLYLDGKVPEGLINAANPYDPANRRTVEVLHDASYYKGKYYIYFGPGPVVALLLPFTLLTGRDLPILYGVWLFTSVGYLALVGVFFVVQRRYFPRASMWAIAGSLIAIGGASMLVALLRRPHIWEFPASAGFCFFAISLLCLVRALHSTRPVTWTCIGGLALGMAVASRPTYVTCSVQFAIPLLLRPVSRYSWRALFAAAAGCSAIVLGLFYYNYARFGNPLEFGQKYQLSAIIEGEARHFSLGYVAFNLRVYFLSALRWVSTFPFHNGIVVPPQPPGHGGYEFSIGLLTNLPIAWFALAGFASFFWKRRATAGDDLRRTIIACVGLAALIQSALLACYFGNCIRYMADFAPYYMLLAAFGLLAGEDFLRNRIARITWRAVGVLLAIASSFVAAMSVVNFYDHGGPPKAYLPVARVLNRPIHALKAWQWPDYGPREIVLSFPTERASGHETLMTVTRADQTSATVFVEYQPEGKVRFGYREPDPRSEIYSPAIARNPDGPHTLRVSIGGPYSESNGRTSRLRAEIDDRPLWDLPVVSLAAFPGKLAVGASPERPFTGKIHAVRQLTMADFKRPAPGGARVRVMLTSSMSGRSFPLVSSGHTNAGDVLFMRVAQDGKVTFGYDHWADALRLSPELPFGFDQERTIEFWVPATAREILVKLDGAIVWRQEAHAFPFTPQTFFVGANAIGASTAEPVLENGVIEARSLPPPPPL